MLCPRAQLAAVQHLRRCTALSAVAERARPALLSTTPAHCRGEQLVLGIESSCDDTGVALLRSTDGAILGESVVGQTEVHAQWGGVVPTLAMEAHKRAIDAATEDVLRQAGLPPERISACAATAGPGLSMCLQVGVRKARALAKQHGLPFVPVHHMEAHALTVRQARRVPFPYLALLVSGGHTMLLTVHGVGEYTLLGSSLDDSVGEAFDKVARMLALPLVPSGGAAVEALAQQGNPHAYNFKVPMGRRLDCNFSYAGVKTAVLLATQAMPPEGTASHEQARRDIAASFQRVAVQHLVEKTQRAVQWARAAEPALSTLVVSGGVACNRLVNRQLQELAGTAGVELVVPPMRLCTDNGVMVAWAGIERLRLGLWEAVPPNEDPLAKVDVWARWPLTNRIDQRFVPEKRSAKKAKMRSSLTEMTALQLAALKPELATAAATL